MKPYVLALALSAVAVSAHAQAVSAAPSLNPVLRMTTQAPQKVSYDAQIADLGQHVKALEQENAALKAQLAKQDAAIGQLLTQVIAVKGSVNSLHGDVGALQSGLGDLSTKFANHRHSYQHANLTKTNVKVVEQTGGLTSDEVDGWATYVNDFWTYDDKTSGPP
jgi:septal ring factor EnvC (AmiA/AmiB activator)